MKTKSMVGAMLALVLFCGALGAQAATTIPFKDGFDGMAVGDAVANPWSFTETAYATNSPGTKDGSARSVYSPDTIRLTTDLTVTEVHSNVWWSSYVRITPQNASTDPAIGSAAAGFFVTDSGQLKAYSNDQWIVLQTGVPTSGWIQFGVQLDYNNNAYNLYRSPNTFSPGDPLQKVNGLPLAFNSGYSDSGELTQFEVSGATYLDTTTLTYGDETPVEPTADSADYAVFQTEQTQLVLDDIVTGNFLQYFGTSGTLNGAYGEALGSMLVNGDKVHFYDGTSWKSFTWDGTSWSADGAYLVGSVTITPTTGMWLELADQNGRAPASVAAFDSDSSHTGAGTTAIAEGWNLLSLPFTAGSKSIVAGDADTQLKIDFAETGDLIYIRRNGQWIVLRYNTTTGWCRFGRTPATESLPAGTGFWYYNRSGAETWNSNTI